jgi:hypothetical protein
MCRDVQRIKTVPRVVARTRRARAFLLVWAAVVSSGLAGSIRADDPDKKRRDALREQAMLDATRQNISRSFEAWVFGRIGDAAAGRVRLNDLLASQVARIDRVCGLTEAQKKKLLVSGRADIKHFFDRYEETKARVVDEATTPREMLMAANQHAMPLRLMLDRRLFEGNSLFQKILVTTLDAQQFAVFEEHKTKSRESEYRSNVAWMTVMIDRTLGMTSDQRGRFQELVLRETRAPNQLGTLRQWAMFYQISTLPEDKLKPIFDDLQWSLLQPQLARAKMLKPTLIQNGFVAADDPVRTEPNPTNMSRKD